MAPINDVLPEICDGGTDENAKDNARSDLSHDAMPRRNACAANVAYELLRRIDD